VAKRIVFLLLFLVGIGWAASIPFRVGLDTCARAVSHAGPASTIVYVAVSCLAYFIPIVSWWILLRAEKAQVSLGSCLKAGLLGFPISFLTPSMYLGGEPVKLIYITGECRVPVGTAAGTLLAAKFQETTGLILMMLISAGAVLNARQLDASQTTFVLAALPTLIVLLGGVMVLYARGFKPLTRSVGALAMFRPSLRRLAVLRRRVHEFEQTAQRSLTTHGKAFLLAQGISLTSAILVLWRAHFFIVFSDAYRGFDGAFLHHVYLLSNLFNIVQLTPGGLGPFEEAIRTAFRLTGYPELDAIAYMFLNRLYDLALFVPGIWMLWRRGMLKKGRSIKT
jgi:uncharacterized protein (TIRG00374 family)